MRGSLASFGRVSAIAMLGVAAILFASNFNAAPEKSAARSNLLLSQGPAVTVSLPIVNLATTIPPSTVIIKPVTTTNIDASLRYTGFQGDFAFDERICTFSPPYVEAAELTANNWNVAANILPNPPGPIRILRVSGFSLNFGSLSGSGTLYNLRLLRTGTIPGTSTALVWQPIPNNFYFIDLDLNSHDAIQVNGLVTILDPSVTPSPTPTPTPFTPTPTPTPSIVVTNTNDAGLGSLRQALAIAQDGDTIGFDSAIFGQTILLTSAELLINKSITISGPGPASLRVARNQQAAAFRVLHVLPNNTVAINGVTISDGVLVNDSGAGIYNDNATLALNNCTISGNIITFSPSVSAMPSGFGGAGIYSNGNLNLANSTVNGNSANFPLSNGGGGIHNTIGNLTITHSIISENSAGNYGGGIINGNGGITTINDSTIINNQANGFGHSVGNGGGISNMATLTIQNSTVSGNNAQGEGGQGGGITSIGPLTVINCTISTNTGSRYGGGIYGVGTITNSTITGNNVGFDGGGLSGTFIVSNSTISGNAANHNGGGFIGGGTISNSTISNNTAASQGGGIYVSNQIQLGNTILKTGATSATIFNNGTVISHGYNISNDNGAGVLTGPGDQINIDPLLGPLQNNGGHTATHALLPNSPAIDAGDPNFTPPPFTDQRDFGYTRVYNGRVDIGGLELQPAPNISPTPSATATATATASPTPTAMATVTITPTPLPFCAAVITQSTSFAITAGNSASCNNGVGHTDNSYWRAFDLKDVSPCGASYVVQSVSFGVESVNQTQSVTVRLYTNNGAPFPGGTRTQIGTATIDVTSAQSGTLVTSPFFAAFSPGTDQLVMELVTPDGQVAGNLFFVGSNTSPQTGPSYLSAPACGVIQPTDLAMLGYPNMHIVLSVSGFCEPPCPSTTPTATATATGTPSPNPTVTPCNIIFSQNFDDLPAGTPTECFYISNVNPDTPPNDLFTPDNDGSTCCVHGFMAQIPNATSVLRFRNNFNTEFSDGIYWDGGVLEVSSPNISGGDFLDITDSHVGGSFVTGGYTGEITDGTGNCLAGRLAWSGNSKGYIDTVINLGPNLAGQTVTFRFRFGSDEALGAPGWWIDTITIADETCPTPTVTPILTPTPTLTPGPTATPTSTPGPARPLNLSTRMLVQTGDSVGIGGFIITGSGPKHVVVRAIGPSLSQFGVPNPLADPVLELHGPPGFDTIINDNWADGTCGNICVPEFCLDPLESEICASLDPGPYTAIVRGNNNGTGVGLVEIYDVDSAPVSKLANISTRAFVSTGADIMIAGFILGGNTENDNVIVRGIGPSLTNVGVPNALANPTLELRNNNGVLLRENDNWQDDAAQAAIITAAGLALSDPAESGIAATLAPGTYTALLAGINEGVGNGLVEVYDLGMTPIDSTPSPAPSQTASPTTTPTPTSSPAVCTENFDGVTAPALPPGWVARNPDPGDGTMWVTSTSNPDSPPNCAAILDQDGISDKALDRSNVTINSSSAVLSFRNNFNLESSDGTCGDRFVLQVSAPNISGGDFLDITDSHVGGIFVTGGYNCDIGPPPKSGRAWGGSSGGYIDTVINLGPILAGQTVTFRFRLITDEAVAAPGVRIDNFSITDASCP